LAPPLIVCPTCAGIADSTRSSKSTFVNELDWPLQFSVWAYVVDDSQALVRQVSSIDLLRNRFEPQVYQSTFQSAVQISGNLILYRDSVLKNPVAKQVATSKYNLYLQAVAWSSRFQYLAARPNSFIVQRQLRSAYATRSLPVLISAEEVRKPHAERAGILGANAILRKVVVVIGLRVFSFFGLPKQAFLYTFNSSWSRNA
jgi:hypothetical protein